MSDFLETSSPSNVIVAGHLNIILDPKEKKGGVLGKDPFQDSVESLIQAHDLLDFKPKSSRFTWSNHKAGAANISAHLDIFLAQSSFREGKYIVSSKILPKLTSDHHPISLIFEEAKELGLILFQFSPFWIARDGFWHIVSNSWSLYIEGSPSFIWEYKLKSTNIALKNWAKKLLNSPISSRQKHVQELYDIQLKMEDVEITKVQLSLEQSAQIKTFHSYRQEEEYLRLKSQSLWLLASDKNNSFFHHQCRERLTRNHIS